MCASCSRFHSDVGRKGRPSEHRGNSQSHSPSPAVGPECGRHPPGTDPPVLQWLLEVSATIPTVTVTGIDMSGPTEAATGWEALRDALHFRGVRSREDLAEQIHARGFRCLDGALISAAGPKKGSSAEPSRLTPEVVAWSLCS